MERQEKITTFIDTIGFNILQNIYCCMKVIYAKNNRFMCINYVSRIWGGTKTLLGVCEETGL